MRTNLKARLLAVSLLGAIGLFSLPVTAADCDFNPSIQSSRNEALASNLDSILSAMRRNEAPELVNAIRNAFEASPKLKSQYETLVSNGHFKGIELVGYRTINSWHLRVRIEDGKLYSSRSFLRDIALRPADTSKNAAELARADLIFFMGFMGQKMANHQAIFAQDNADFQNFKPEKSEKGDMDISSLLGGISRRHKRDSALGYLNGWNLAVCSIISQNQGSPLSSAQKQMLTSGLSFRRMLFDVAKATGEPLAYEANGTFSLTEDNINRLTDALEVMRPNELP